MCKLHGYCCRNQEDDRRRHPTEGGGVGRDSPGQRVLHRGDERRQHQCGKCEHLRSHTGSRERVHPAKVRQRCERKVRADVHHSTGLGSIAEEIVARSGHYQIESTSRRVGLAHADRELCRLLHALHECRVEGMTCRAEYQNASRSDKALWLDKLHFFGRSRFWKHQSCDDEHQAAKDERDVRKDIDFGHDMSWCKAQCIRGEDEYRDSPTRIETVHELSNIHGSTNQSTQ
mmetsp:Transcript_19469/g.48685  ORF Transcript_19469/g.48685 Transcript_19469/m.48685 type:complete len:231 (+) Transcript_19469:330-1022(+)